MTVTAKEGRAWDAFWKDGSIHDGEGGCLPGANHALNHAQTSAWEEFAAQIPRRGRTLDLGTGDGRVMGALVSARRDLKPTGIDRASTLPRPPQGTRVKAGVEMEHLPFPDRHFVAVTSQFGFEYGDLELTAAEVARVVADDGIVGFMTHRADGPILAHNTARRAEIIWVRRDARIFERARSHLQVRERGITAPLRVFADIILESHARFGPSSVAKQIAQAVLQTLYAGAMRPIGEIDAILDRIDQQSDYEIVRINGLERACQAMSDDRTIADMFSRSGLIETSREDLHVSGDCKPFAHFRTLRPIRQG